MKKMSSSKISVDFSGVESGGGRKVPDGEYLLKVVEVEVKDSQAGNQYLAFKYKVANGPFAGATIWDNVSLKSTALWRLRTLLECFGMNPADGKMDLDLPKMVGKTVFVEVANETYQGKEKPRIANLIAGGQETAKSSAPSEGSSLKVGGNVKFTNDGETFTGKLLAISGDTCRVEVEGDEWELELSELSAA
jgi:hypothetical protein